MKVKILKSYVYVTKEGRITPVRSGTVLELSKNEAEGLIARGRAVLVEPEKKPEPAPVPTPKTVTPKRKVV